jgi:hypothetical protein
MGDTIMTTIFCVDYENNAEIWWDDERARDYAAKWEQRYGTQDCLVVVDDGEELPTDAVLMHYPVVG